MPANRLGQLLTEARLREGADLEDFAKRGDFTVGELSDFEAGHRVLTEGLISEVTEIYEIDCGPIVPQRAELTIDLNHNLLSAAGHALPLDSAAHDHVLERYLSLVYVLRNHQPGADVPLRDRDVAILAASLAEREELIEEQLLRAMAEERETVTGLVGWFRNRLWVPGAGLLVGAVSVGALVMLSANSPAEAETADNPEPDLGPDGSPQNGVGRLISPAASLTTSIGTPTTSILPAAEQSPVSIVVGNAPAIPGSPERIGAEAEALLPFEWDAVLPGWTIVYSGPNSGFRGLTYPYDQTIEMFVRDDDTPQALAGILAHEIGHAIDVTHFGDSERSRWREVRNIDDAQWWPGAFASDFESGAGDFAEAFAYWAVRDESSSQIAGEPTNEQLAVIDNLFDSIQ